MDSTEMSGVGYLASKCGYFGWQILLTQFFTTKTQSIIYISLLMYFALIILFGSIVSSHMLKSKIGQRFVEFLNWHLRNFLNNSWPPKKQQKMFQSKE